MHLGSFLQKVLVVWFKYGIVHINDRIHFFLLLSYYFVFVMDNSQDDLFQLGISYM